MDARATVERVLACAANERLAWAIFRAAQDGYPGRRITVRRGESIAADTAPALQIGIGFRSAREC
jgi:hypothetical protein